MMIKLYCCHNLLQLQGANSFDSASQRVRLTVPIFCWSYIEHPKNTQIGRIGNNNDSIIIIIIIIMETLFVFLNVQL